MSRGPPPPPLDFEISCAAVVCAHAICAAPKAHPLLSSFQNRFVTPPPRRFPLFSFSFSKKVNVRNVSNGVVSRVVSACGGRARGVDIGFDTNAALQEKVSFVLFEFVFFFAQKN